MSRESDLSWEQVASGQTWCTKALPLARLTLPRARTLTAGYRTLCLRGCDRGRAGVPAPLRRSKVAASPMADDFRSKNMSLLGCRNLAHIPLDIFFDEALGRKLHGMPLGQFGLTCRLPQDRPRLPPRSLRRWQVSGSLGRGRL